MTLEKAIEYLDRHFILHLDIPRADLTEAATLGIEALKRCQHNYLNPQRADFRRLPGETDE